MTPSRIAIVHYHLRPGGVTRVIGHAVAALQGTPCRLAVLTGDAPGAAHGSAGMAWRRVPGLDYAGLRKDRRGLAERLESAAREALGGRPDLWHVHNHALGKNPALTAAVSDLARRGHRLVLQLHDFAEDGRPAAYAALRRAGLAADLYPRAPHVRYAVINSRDAGILREAGMDPARVYCLPNAVTLETYPGPAPDSEPAARDDLVLYPTRAIRRKNLGEFLLWAAIATPGTRFAVTLAPTATADVRAYRRWVALARRWALPIAFEQGRAGGASLAALLRTCAAVATTSVAEGFGLAFLEPWLAGRPLVGRDLPEITADFQDAGVRLDGLYARLDLPLAWLDATALRARIAAGRRQMLAAYGRAGSAADDARACAAAIRDRTVDFGCLDEALQAEVLRALRADPARRRALRPPDILGRRPGPTTIAQNRAAIRSRYGLDGYRRRLLALYRAVADSQPGPVHPVNPGALLDRFLAPDRFRLLRA